MATRQLSPEEAAVLLVFSIADELDGGELQERMGPRGVRSPSGEALGVLLADRLLGSAIGDDGQPMRGVYRLLPEGEVALDAQRDRVVVEIDRRIAEWREPHPRDKRKRPVGEIKRLEQLRGLLTGKAAVQSDAERGEVEPTRRPNRGGRRRQAVEAE